MNAYSLPESCIPSSITPPSAVLNPSQRIEPIGYDVKSNAYWLIGGELILPNPQAFAYFSHMD
jgi:hypothetical protein